MIAPSAQADRPERAAAAGTSWRRALGIGLGAFVISRLAVVGGAYCLAIFDAMDLRARRRPAPLSTRETIEDYLLQARGGRADGRWLKEIAEHGYQTDLPKTISVIANNGGAAAGYLPGYPLLARAFDWVFPGGIDHALLGFNMLAGLVGLVFVGVLARDAFDVATAQRAMILYCVFPGSIVMSWASSEVLLVASAAGCFVAISRRRWLLSGAAAAIATATSPLGIALVPACIVASVSATARKPQWRPLIASALAPMGALAFIAYLDAHADEPWAWFRVRGQLFAHPDWLLPIRLVWRFVHNPLANAPDGPTQTLTTLAIALVAVGVYSAVRTRIPLPWLVYVAGIAVLMFVPWLGPPRPRLLWAAFPFAIAVAAWSARVSRQAWQVIIVGSAGSLVILEVIYGRFGALP